MTTKNLFLRIFFYSILVVSSIHFINIKAMIESRFNNPFAFENFSARAADDLLPVEFIKYKDPSVADKVTILSNGMINIKGISELSYAGVPKELPTYTFSEQKEGFYGKNIGYFRFNIISPYPEAESVVYVINNDKQFTYNLVDRAFEIDHPLAQKKDGVNWTPINWGTQNLLIKFIDKSGKELGIKTLVISNSPIKQQQPTNFIAKNIKPGLIFPVEILNPAILDDGSINFGDTILKTDGTTDKKDLILSKEQSIGLSTNRYFGFSLMITEPYSSISFFINGQELQVNNDVFLINSEKEKINVYFAVAKEDFSKNFIPYYESAQNFNLVVRLLDEKNLIIGEQEVNFSFNIIKESNALAKEFISVKDPKELSNFAEISNGLIVIKNLGELDYNGTFSNLLNFSFNNQAMGQLGEDIGYFTAIISNPYPEAMTASWTIDGGKVFYHDFSSSGSSISVDFALASRGDKINWTPLENNSQKLLIQFFDSEGGLVGEKEVNVLFEDIKQKQPSAVKSAYISSQITPYTIMKASDGKVDINEIILNKDGSTNFKELNLTKYQGIGDSKYRYLDFSFSLVGDEIIYPNISFFVDGSPYNSNNSDFIIQHDKEKNIVKVYFAVAEVNEAKQFVPYYNEALKNFSIVTRLKDERGMIKIEKIVSTSFNLSDGLVQTDLEGFPAKQFLFNNEALVSSNGQIGFNSNTFFYQQEKGDYLVDAQLNNKYLFPKDLEYMKELNPSCRYIRFTLSLNSEKPKLNSLKYDVGGKDYDYNFLDQNNNSVYVFNRNQEIDFYYPVTCYLKGETGNYWKNNPINSKWKIDYLDELSKNNYQYYFNVNLNLSGVCNKANELIELPIDAFYFEDEYLNKFSQKKSGFLYYNYNLTPEMQKKYITQNVSEFSGLDYLRYFKVNFKPFEVTVKDPSFKSGYSIKKFNFSKVENIQEFPKSIIAGKDSLYFLAFDYSNKKLNPYSLDHGLILNLIDDSCNIYSSKFQILSKPIIEDNSKNNNPSTPVVEVKPIVPEYKEVYNPVTGELIREKINPEKENLTTPSKEAAKVVDAKLLTEAQMVDKSPKEEIKTLLLRSVNVEKSDSELEKKVEVKHQSLFVGASTPEVKTSLKNYLAYGTESTVRLGEGQRAATVINYTSVKGNIPQTESDIEDVLKIANNRVPLIRNSELEPKFLGNFYRLNNIIKENDITKIDEDNFILELNQFLRFSYGILPMERSIAKEKWAIELFVKNYNKLPQTDGEWRIVNSWAYRNVLISQVENNLDWINSVASENSEITVELLDKFFELAVK